MWQIRLGVVGTIVFLAFITAGGLKGGQNQGTVGKSTEAVIATGVGPLWFSVSPRNLDPLPFPHLMSGSGGHAAPGVGIRNQPFTVSRSTNQRSALLIGLYITQGVLQALDAESTVRALRSGTAREANPLLSPFASQPVALAAFKVALTFGTIYAIDRVNKTQPRFAIATLGAINAGYVFIVQRNYRSSPVR